MTTATATKGKGSRKQTPKASEPEAPEIRSAGTGLWPEKGQTSDSGAGSRAKAALRELDDAATKGAKIAYDKVVGIVGKLSEPVQRAIGFALASDFTWECLVSQSKKTFRPVWKNADQETWDRLGKMQGEDGEPLPLSEVMARFQSVKSEVSAERKAKRAAKSE